MIALLVNSRSGSSILDTKSAANDCHLVLIIGGLGGHGRLGHQCVRGDVHLPVGDDRACLQQSVLLSMVFGTSRGVLVRSLRRRHLNQIIDRQHVLRGLFELLEPHTANDRIGSHRGVSVFTTAELKQLVRVPFESNSGTMPPVNV